MTSKALFKHDMTLTSLDAFYSLAPHELAVLDVFAKSNTKGELPELSCHQVEDILKWGIQSVSGRLTELKRMFFIEPVATHVRPNGRSENVFKITKSGLQWLNDRRGCPFLLRNGTGRRLNELSGYVKKLSMLGLWEILQFIGVRKAFGNAPR